VPLATSIPLLATALANQKAVLSAFPDATHHYYYGYQSKAVNKDYTKFDFQRNNWGVWVVPYCEVWVPKIEDPNELALVKVHSVPFKSRLVYKDRAIRFSRIAINWKTHKFRDTMLNACRVEIMSFIKANPELPMNKRNLEPCLEKMLSFC
jgi:hypothetical protein